MEQATAPTTEVSINGAPFAVSTLDLMRLISDGDKRRQAEQSLGMFKGLLDSITQSIGDRSNLALPAKIGEALQGGIYVGPYFDIENGTVEHLIASEYLADSDVPDAESAVSSYRSGGFTDWQLPTQQEAMAAYIHAKKFFKSGYHWTRTPYGSRYAWAVGVGSGSVNAWARNGSFRVRLFRRFTA